MADASLLKVVGGTVWSGGRLANMMKAVVVMFVPSIDGKWGSDHDGSIALKFDKEVDVVFREASPAHGVKFKWFENCIECFDEVPCAAE